ncbi:recombinase family protein [Desulfopila sp. IMCC35006]|uniref:recombinase family protein n=1 Tax=Desulfopila sp. IMCC35006 TaxID=2569542 RepID=UPI0010ABD9B2|nr:recombinase family protein [Desulfopila sp. IMCC35006]TKB23188.1 recombinase family protein [Desulfopila sp. IMCC35006]
MSNGKQIGYTRVSSISQNTERQLADIHLDKTFEDKISAKDTNRKGLNECLEYLREDDVLHVHSIDRLARNLHDLQKIVSDLIDRGISVHFHKENLIFNGSESAMSKLMLQMMGAFAEFERNLIHERQKEGIAIAKQNGKQLGRKAALNKEQITEVKYMLNAGFSKSMVATKFGVSRQTIYNVM